MDDDKNEASGESQGPPGASGLMKLLERKVNKSEFEDDLR